MALTYRTRMVLGLVGAVFPLLLMTVWLTVVAEGGPPAGWTAGDFLSYYAAAVVLWNLSGQPVLWEWDADLRSATCPSGCCGRCTPSTSTPPRTWGTVPCTC